MCKTFSPESMEKDSNEDIKMVACVVLSRTDSRGFICKRRIFRNSRGERLNLVSGSYSDHSILGESLRIPKDPKRVERN